MSPNPIQKKKINLSTLKDDFSSRTDPFIFTSIAPVLLDQSNEISWVFSSSQINKSHPAQSTVSFRSDSSSEANSSCCQKSDSWSHLRVESNISMDILLKTSHPKPLEAAYHWERKKLVQISDLKFCKT